MKANLLFLFIAFGFFSLSGIVLNNKQGFSDWICAIFIFCIGIQWVYAFAFKLNMYTLYAAHCLSAENEEHAIYRSIHLILGLLLCLATTLLAGINA